MNMPRALLVTPAAFNRVTGTGITFTNLFRDWPKDALACVHDDPVPTTDEVCERYYRLGPAEIRAWGPLQRLRAAAAAPSTAAVAPVPPPASIGAMRRVRKLIFGDGLPEIGRLSPELEAWIADFRPDVLYTILGGNGMMELVEAIRARFDLPMVVHVMDDWVEAHFRTGLLSFIERGRMRRLVRGAAAKATTGLAIGDAMAEAYEHRYRRPFQAFQNAIDVERWSALAKHDLSVGPSARLLYTGSILPFAQDRSLADCCRVVADLAARGQDITLDIHAPDFLVEPLRPQLCVSPAIRIRPPITDDEDYFRALAAADILLLPVNFDPASVTYIRYSMPTKVPPYLVAGTPVLVYGPRGVGQVDYAARAGWGLVVDQPGLPGLTEAMTRLLTDTALRRSLSGAAKRAAAERHDATTVRRNFQAVLTKTARGET